MELSKGKKLLETAVSYILLAPIILILCALGVLLLPIILPIILAIILFQNMKEARSHYLTEKEKKKYRAPIQFFDCKKANGFLSKNNQIIYIEREENIFLNRFFRENYDKINLLFSDYYFVFIPLTLTNLQQQNLKAIKYYCPNIKSEINISQNHVTPQDIYDTLYSFICEDKQYLPPGLIRYKDNKDGSCVCSYFQITFFEDEYLWKQLGQCIEVVKEQDILRSEDGKPLEARAFFTKKEFFADNNFPSNVKNIAKDIQLKIEKLRQLGVNETVLRSLFIFDEKPQLSRLQITKNHKIILLDYNEMEIKMPPLVKAVFFLFLKHPEGILFKHLSDYKEELTSIYLRLSNRENLLSIERSIDDITDSTKNAINEKCSRIREAFVKEFDEALAQYYFVSGERFTPKKVQLDRSLVVWEIEI